MEKPIIQGEQVELHPSPLSMWKARYYSFAPVYTYTKRHKEESWNLNFKHELPKCI